MKNFDDKRFNFLTNLSIYLFQSKQVKDDDEVFEKITEIFDEVFK